MITKSICTYINIHVYAPTLIFQWSVFLADAFHFHSINFSYSYESRYLLNDMKFNLLESNQLVYKWYNKHNSVIIILQYYNNITHTFLFFYLTSRYLISHWRTRTVTLTIIKIFNNYKIIKIHFSIYVNYYLNP